MNTNRHNLFSLMLWDLKLMHRQNLLIISFLVLIMYLGIFFLIRPLGELENLLIILLFNDPVISGYMFAAALLMLEKSQNSLQAIRVLPMRLSSYLLSKALVLGLISCLSMLMLTIGAHGFHFQYVHLILGGFLLTMVFVCIGFYLGLKAANFNYFLMYTIGVLIPMALPILYLFGIGEASWFVLFPSFPGILLLKATLGTASIPWLIYSYLYLGLLVFISWKLCLNTFKKLSL